MNWCPATKPRGIPRARPTLSAKVEGSLRARACLPLALPLPSNWRYPEARQTRMGRDDMENCANRRYQRREGQGEDERRGKRHCCPPFPPRLLVPSTASACPTCQRSLSRSSAHHLRLSDRHLIFVKPILRQISHDELVPGGARSGRQPSWSEAAGSQQESWKRTSTSSPRCWARYGQD